MMNKDSPMLIDYFRLICGARAIIPGDMRCSKGHGGVYIHPNKFLPHQMSDGIE